MTTGYRNSVGTDTDNLFDPDVVGDGPTAAAYKKSDGTLLKYAAAKYGTVGPDTGYRLSNGADIATLWSAKGTANYPLPIGGANFIAHSSGVVSPSMDSNINVQINANGSYSVTVAGNGAGNTPSTSGTWLPSGASASDYQVQFVWSQSSQYPSGPATVTNGASSYAACTSNRSIVFDAQVGQSTGLDKGSVGSVNINLKYVPSGKVTTTTFAIDIESQGSG